MSPAGVEGSPAIKGTRGAPRRMPRGFGENADRQGPDLHPPGARARPPLSLRSYLTQPPLWSVLDANFMLQNLSAQVWKPDPQDWEGGLR